MNFSFVYESKMMECRLNVETLIQLNRNISVCVSGKIPREISHSLLFSPILIPGKFTTTTMVINDDDIRFFVFGKFLFFFFHKNNDEKN